MRVLETDIILKVKKCELEDALNRGIVTIRPKRVILKCGKKEHVFLFDGADLVYGSKHKELHLGVKA